MVGEPEAATHEVFYRGFGWPGSSGVFKDGKVKKVDSFYHAICWTVPACHACGDCMAPDHADITVADPWGIEDPNESSMGSNLLFVWTEKGKALLHELGEKLHMENCASEAAILSADFNVIQSKLDRMPYFLGKELSLPKRFKIRLLLAYTWCVEKELEILNPNSRFIKMQATIRLSLGNFRRFLGGKKT
jgi:hypothetical protein